MRFRNLIPSKLRFSNRFSRSNESRSMSQTETIVHNISTEELSECSTPPNTTFDQGEAEPFSAWHYALNGPDIDWSNWSSDEASAARKLASEKNIIEIYNASGEELPDYYVDLFENKDISAFAEDNIDTSGRPVSETDTIIRNYSDENFSEPVTFKNTTYHQDKFDIIEQKEVVAVAEDNVDTSRKSASETETIIHRSPNKKSSESIRFENTTCHQDKVDIIEKKEVLAFAEDNIDTSRKSVSETDTIFHNHSTKVSSESVTFENTIYHEEKTPVFEKENVATAEESAPAIETVIHSSSKLESLESAISKETTHHTVWQGKTWTPSQYSASIYSQDGIDDVVYTLKTKQTQDGIDDVVYTFKTKQIIELKAMLATQQLEIDELHHAISKGSNRSGSETGTVIHIPLNEKSSGSFISKYTVDEPKVTDISRRQRYRNKLRRYLSSTQELIAPLKALHPNNRPEKGHTKMTRQQKKEAIEARYGPIFFKSVPFESTEEDDAPIFYGSKPVEEQALLVTEKPVVEQALSIPQNLERVKYSADDYIGFIKDLTDDYIGVAKPLADDYLGVTGFNLRTGELDSSEEHIIPRRRRVHWGATENGWESTECPVIVEAITAPDYPVAVKTYSPTVKETINAPKSPTVKEMFNAPKSPTVKETTKSPQSANINETLNISQPDFLGEHPSKFCIFIDTSTTTTGEDILAWRKMVWH
ncbi:hypothetical protein DSL72_002733 [Monilinia vaccinii-corymbosi]|uniref:Uncharacterized protein n=1 Tax=Monilinia vaccinii-corymbosi TaxID=61207 RepID=A0A8A3PDA6_9HELO|nr:hypothetical protein DSL72_002733 [Monilinia vaccinii-corymbosi]